MWFRPVNEMVELLSGMPVPPFEDESSRVRRSEVVQGSGGSVKCFRLPQRVTRTPGWRAPVCEEQIYIQGIYICENIQYLILFRIEVPTAVVIKSFKFLDITTCSPSKDNRRFGDIYGSYLQGRISQEWNWCEGDCYLDYVGLHPRRNKSSI
jgi:hypothetical protein